MTDNWQKIAVSVVAGLILAGVVGVWSMTVSVAKIETNVERLVLSVSDHDVRIRVNSEAIQRLEARRP